MNNLFNRDKTVVNSNQLQSSVINQNILLGKLLSRQNILQADKIINNIHQSEFKVFSQWGDDGIIQFLVNYLDIRTKSFVEFGVENYQEANTRFLLMNNNWKGLIMDGSSQNISSVKKENLYWQYNLKAVSEWITQDNINTILQEQGFTGEIGLLHIDIDGNDYWVWKEINAVNPIIVIVEYNSVFGSNNPWTIPYQKEFYRTNAHYSNLYYGSSLLSLCDLATEKGYSFIGCNSSGNNSYFVRNDFMKDLKGKTAEEGFVESNFRESRNEEGQLTFLSGQDRIDLLRGLKVYNTRNSELEEI